MLADRDGDVRRNLADEACKRFRILQAVAVRDVDSLLAGPDPLLLVFPGQRFDGFSAPAHFGTGNDVPCLISEQDRLDMFF